MFNVRSLIVEFKHTFRKKLEDPDFRDAIYDYIVELEAEIEALKGELYHLTGKAVFEVMKEDRDALRDLALDELVEQAEDLDMGY